MPEPKTRRPPTLLDWLHEISYDALSRKPMPRYNGKPVHLNIVYLICDCDGEFHPGLPNDPWRPLLCEWIRTELGQVVIDRACYSALRNAIRRGGRTCPMTAPTY